MNGTSLQDLQNIQYGAMQNHQYEQGHNAAHVIQQAQHAPYYDIMDNNYPQMQNCKINMDQLANDISANLPEEDIINGIEEHLDEEIISTQNTQNGYLSFIPSILREPLLIIVIYILLSQPFVQNNIGKYIKQVNPIQGKVSIIGIFIYAVLLAVIYTITKHILL